MASSGILGSGEPDLSVTHQLPKKWTLWYFEKNYDRKWTENLKTVATFETIESFWAVKARVKQPSKLYPGCDYSLFKYGVQPMWEDEANFYGGCWQLRIRHNTPGINVNEMWTEMMMAVIGEAFEEHSNQVCGAVFNWRAKESKLGLWTASLGEIKAITDIGVKLRKILSLPEDIPLKYHSHQDTMENGYMGRAWYYA